MKTLYAGLSLISFVALFGVAGASDAGNVPFEQTCMLAVLFLVLGLIFFRLSNKAEKKHKKTPGGAATPTEQKENKTTYIISR